MSSMACRKSETVWNHISGAKLLWTKSLQWFFLSQEKKCLRPLPGSSCRRASTGVSKPEHRPP